MENFIDRKKELEYLENEYQSNRSFILIFLNCVYRLEIRRF